MHLIHMYKTMYVPSLHVKTVFNVAKPGIIARLLKETGVHGWIIAAMLKDMKDLKGLTSCESWGRNSDTPDVSGKAVWRRLHFRCGNMYLAEGGGKVEGSRSRALVRRAKWTGNI